MIVSQAKTGADGEAVVMEKRNNTYDRALVQDRDPSLQIRFLYCVSQRNPETPNEIITQHSSLHQQTLSTQRLPPPAVPRSPLGFPVEEDVVEPCAHEHSLYQKPQWERG
ncbi:hypothetical protein E5288_WYG006128 [Bos mutus]|uniref:Uncharacterized protein n=1 Tax=Bos mutus TaxID=72004 RepID=A0A6B0QT84_9CETA|nr:hypothetical protein [Bos mutus]